MKEGICIERFVVVEVGGRKPIGGNDGNWSLSRNSIIAPRRFAANEKKKRTFI